MWSASRIIKSPFFSWGAFIYFFNSNASSVGYNGVFQCTMLSFFSLPTLRFATSVHTKPRALIFLYNWYNSSVVTSVLVSTLSVTSRNILFSLFIFILSLNNGVIIYGLFGKLSVYLFIPIFNTLSPTAST